jgi:hypothetical protein
MSIELNQAKAPAIRFGKVAKEDRNRSIEMGRLVTTDIDMVYVKQIGEKDEVERVARDWIDQLKAKAIGVNGMPPSIPMEWADKAELLYSNWQKGYETPEDGYPVRNWPILTPAQVTNLHAMNTFTVEQISQWNESAIGMYGVGGRDLRDKAKLWLESGDAKAEQIHALQVENDDLKTKLSTLIDEFKALKQEVQNDKPKRNQRSETSQ